MTDPHPFTEALLTAYQTRTRVSPETGLPQTRDEALAVQAAVSAARGAVAGFKVAGQGDAPPILAPIAACDVVQEGGSRPLGDRFAVEMEIGFRLDKPLPQDGFPASPQEYFTPHLVLELVDQRIDGAVAEQPLPRLADAQLNAGLVVGPALSDWDGRDFTTLTSRLLANGTALLDGEATVPGGSALAHLELLCASVGDHCGGLMPGQIVITGSLCGCPWFDTPTDIEGHVDGFGSIRVRLA